MLLSSGPLDQLTTLRDLDPHDPAHRCKRWVMRVNYELCLPCRTGIRVDGAGRHLRLRMAPPGEHRDGFLDTLEDMLRRYRAGTDVCGGVNPGKDVRRLTVREQES